MDRTMTNDEGLTLLEVMIVTAIVGIVLSIAIFSFARIRQNESINDDMHNISTFLKSRRLTAFTVKEAITIQISSDGYSIMATMNENSAGSISLHNPFKFNLAKFTINSRGLFTTQGNIRLATACDSAPYSCVIIATERIQLGKLKNGTCNAK